MRFVYNFLITIFLIFISFLSSFGEGTKEIYPVGGGFYKVALYPTDPIRNKFALYTATEPERLYITILNPNEVIFFGFNDGANTNNFKFRIKDQLGNIVYPETQIPTSGQGYITDLLQARTGPVSIFPGGYSPRRYIAPTTGDYYIEFTTGNNNKDFENTSISRFQILIQRKRSMDASGQKHGNVLQQELRFSVLQNFSPIPMTRSLQRLILTACGLIHLIFPAIPRAVMKPGILLKTGNQGRVAFYIPNTSCF